MSELILSCWLEGPQWLKEESLWPPEKILRKSATPCSEEDNVIDDKLVGNWHVELTIASQKKGVSNIMDLGRYSSVDKLLKVTSMVLRFIANCRSATERIIGEVSIDEKLAAMMIWIKCVQTEIFKDENFP